MNRTERRRLQKQQKKAQSERTYVLKESELENLLMTPVVQDILERKVAERVLEIDASYTLDLDTMVIWTLYQYGWRERKDSRSSTKICSTGIGSSGHTIK